MFQMLFYLPVVATLVVAAGEPVQAPASSATVATAAIRRTG